LMSNQEYWEAAKILPIVCLGFILGSLTYPFQTGILIKKKTMYLLYVTTISGITALSLNFILVPHFGAYGCAAAGCLAVTITCAITFFLSQRMYSIKYDYGAWGKALGVAIAIFFISQSIPSSSIWHSLIIKSLLALLFPAGLFYLKCFSPDEAESLKAYRDRFLVWSLRNGKRIGRALL